MVKDGQRFCDCCEEEIPKGSKYRRARVASEQAHILNAAVSGDRDLKFTWTEPRWLTAIDICLECTVSMGRIPTKEEMN